MLMWLLNLDFAGTDAETAEGLGTATGKLTRPTLIASPVALFS